MKIWLTQGSSGRRDNFSPISMVLYSSTVYLAADFWNVTQRWGKRCVTFQKNSCEEDCWALVVFFVALVAIYAPLYVGRGG